MCLHPLCHPVSLSPLSISPVRPPLLGGLAGGGGRGQGLLAVPALTLHPIKCRTMLYGKGASPAHLPYAPVRFLYGCSG